MKSIVRADEEAFVLTPEGAERRVLSYGGGIMLVHFTFRGPVVTPLHQHPHEQIGYVVTGMLDLMMDGHPVRRLTAGSSYYVPPNIMHGIVTHEPTVVIDCFTPVRDDFLQQDEAT